ncbi:hypothetical protein BD310DRAFT_924853 [Dichomitus squalens]|uniref:Uncharacterized protein n=1 Tax=Dichomitus squalens TaxID=114155 RepID=A0A4Q9PXQ1_9APHY|nr:hypothetical protein BD310DRAFT_924853 [Dichomitus squalens]
MATPPAPAPSPATAPTSCPVPALLSLGRQRPAEVPPTLRWPPTSILSYLGPYILIQASIYLSSRRPREPSALRCLVPTRTCHISVPPPPTAHLTHSARLSLVTGSVPTYWLSGPAAYMFRPPVLCR